MTTRQTITVDANDTLLGSRVVGPLASGASDTGSTAMTLPTGLASGPYYLIAAADGDTQVPETIETNNWRAVVVQITAAP